MGKIFKDNVVTSFLAINMAEKLLIKEKVADLEGIITVLDSEIQGDFDLILARQGLLSASQSARVNGLREELQPLVNKVARAYPDMRVAIFSKDLDTEVAYGISLHRHVPIALEKEYPKRKMYDSVEPQVDIQPSIWGNTLHYSQPIIREGRVIGRITVSQLMSQVGPSTLQKLSNMLWIWW